MNLSIIFLYLYYYRSNARRLSTLPGLDSLVIWWHLILDVSDQWNPHLRRVVTPQHVTHEVCFYLHLYLPRNKRQDRLNKKETENGRKRIIVPSLTISSVPRSTPHKILENQSSSCARPSSGSSTKSANGFSSNTRENCLLSLVQFVTVGVMFRKILKPTCPSG